MLWSKGQIRVSLWFYSGKCHVPRGETIPKAAGRARGEQVPVAQLGHGMHEVSQIHGAGAGASSHLAHCSRHLCQSLPTFIFLELPIHQGIFCHFTLKFHFLSQVRGKKVSQAVSLCPVPCLGVAKRSFAGELNSQHGKV